MEQTKINTWVEIIVQTRQQLLNQELSVDNWNPGKCFEGDGVTDIQSDLSFKNCCNGLPNTYNKCFDTVTKG